MVLLVTGIPLAAALVVKAFASIANVVSLGGYVNRVT